MDKSNTKIRRVFSAASSQGYKKLFLFMRTGERDYLKTILHRIYGKIMALRLFIRPKHHYASRVDFSKSSGIN